VKYLESYHRFTAKIQTLFDMPNNKRDLLWRFLEQNNGRLSKRARANEFSALSEDEASTIEKMFVDAVGS